jgi:hypothetical protein
MPLPTYPNVPGGVPWSVHGVKGPTSYTAVVTGAPLTSSSGGQQTTASAFGLQYIIGCWAVSGSDDGQYYVRVYQLPYHGGGSSTSIIIQWFVAATGAEVSAATNLSARTIRLVALGA